MGAARPPLVGAYFEAASLAVTEMGGKVAKKLGNGLVALFGYPLAHENDVERAAHAARAVQRALTELNCKYDHIGKPALAARITIDLGPLVVDMPHGVAFVARIERGESPHKWFHGAAGEGQGRVANLLFIVSAASNANATGGLIWCGQTLFF